MKQQPLVSFILTDYNLPTELLCECIDSILRLSLQPSEREIIVVDDGSDESPMNDLLRYGDEIIYVRQKNGGVSTARNTGMAMAKGKYIQLVDGDDCLLQTPYDHCLDIVRHHQDADVVVFDFTHHSQEKQNSFGEPARFGLLLSLPSGGERRTILHARHRVRRGRGVHSPVADTCRDRLYHRCEGLLLP